jgi:hypothetical protein
LLIERCTDPRQHTLPGIFMHDETAQRCQPPGRNR